MAHAPLFATAHDGRPDLSTTACDQASHRFIRTVATPKSVEENYDLQYNISLYVERSMKEDVVR